MIYDGKTYRNLESQVGYLTDVSKQLDDRITELAANIPSKMIVSELPETGDPSITYYVGPKGTEPNLYYEVWVWVQEEEEGPFVWRELEDTDQVDLSGYLEKQTGSTSYKQAYIKLENGTQGMASMSYGDAGEGFIVLRAANAQLNLPNQTTYAPSDDQAVSKRFTDTNFVGKNVSGSAYPQVYGKNTNGTQTLFNVNGNPVSDTIPFRFAYGHIKLPNEITYPPTDDDYAISKRFGDSVYLAKATGVSTYGQAYVKAADGSQTRYDISVAANAYSIPYRDANAQIKVPETPIANADAASKKYVDDNATGVRYIHQLHLTYTTAPDEYLTVMATLVNRSSAPITAMSYDVFREMSLQYGDHGQSLGYNPVMVVKCPNSFHGHDFPDPIDGVYWKDLNNSTEGYATSATMTLSVSDYVTLF